MNEECVNLGLQNQRELSLTIQSAYQQDCENILRAFAACSTFSFDTFANIYKENHFGSVYSGVFQAYDIAHFTEMIMLCTKKYLLYSKCKYIQVGALYLLYALYIKQPVRNVAKIRLLREELIEICSFLNSIAGREEPKAVCPEYYLTPEDAKLEDNTFSVGATEFIEKLNEITQNDIEDLRLIDTEYKKLYSEYLKQTSSDINIGINDIERISVADEMEELFKRSVRR